MSVAPTLGLDAEALRRAVYDKGEATRTDLVGVMALDAGDPAYLALLAEVAAAAMGPELADADADWLVARLGDGCGLQTRAQFETLKSVLAHSVRAPAALVAFAVREVERAILTGHRLPLGGAETEPGHVAASDAAALRAILAAPCAGPRIARVVAEALFDIAHATQAAENDPAFAELFARAVGDYALEAAAGNETGLPEIAQRLLQNEEARASADRLAEEGYVREIERTEARVKAVASVQAGEARWIFAHLTRGELTASERRLLTYLRDRKGERYSHAA